MSSESHITAPTLHVDAGGIRFAYRRFGASTGVPLLFMPQYRAGMDHWDPAVTDVFAASRPLSCSTTLESQVQAAKRPTPLKPWLSTPPISLAHSAFRWLMSLDFQLAGTLRKRSPSVIRKRSDALCCRAPDRAGARYQAIPSTENMVIQWIP
jgi:hypothetical protein